MSMMISPMPTTSDVIDSLRVSASSPMERARAPPRIPATHPAEMLGSLRFGEVGAGSVRSGGGASSLMGPSLPVRERD